MISAESWVAKNPSPGFRSKIPVFYLVFSAYINRPFLLQNQPEGLGVLAVMVDTKDIDARRDTTQVKAE